MIHALRHDFKVVDLIQVAAIPRSTYYYWIKRRERPDKYKEAKATIAEIFHEHKGRYGHRNIQIELGKRGIQLDRKTVLKLTNAIGLTCRVRMKKYRSYRGDAGNTAPNVLNRDFTADKLNQNENFSGILKTELLYLQEFESVEHFRQELEDYLVYYNEKRMKAK